MIIRNALVQVERRGGPPPSVVAALRAGQVLRAAEAARAGVYVASLLIYGAGDGGDGLICVVAVDGQVQVRGCRRRDRASVDRRDEQHGGDGQEQQAARGAEWGSVHNGLYNSLSTEVR